MSKTIKSRQKSDPSRAGKNKIKSSCPPAPRRPEGSASGQRARAAAAASARQVRSEGTDDHDGPEPPRPPVSPPRASFLPFGLEMQIKRAGERAGERGGASGSRGRRGRRDRGRRAQGRLAGEARGRGRGGGAAAPGARERRPVLRAAIRTSRARVKRPVPHGASRAEPGGGGRGRGVSPVAKEKPALFSFPLSYWERRGGVGEEEGASGRGRGEN